MFGQRVTGLLDRFDERVGESLVAKILSHLLDQSLPQCLSASFVDPAIADHGKFVGARSNKN